jgi:UDP-N-acetylmuramoyl-L-alanyl-D-glutamate--2,6-diaminopimelate ligase
MKWNDVLADTASVHRMMSGNPDVTGVQYDSRRVEPGDVFVAMRGGATDGNKFVWQAVERGAVAVVTDSRDVAAELHSKRSVVAVAVTDHGRRALAEVSAAVFGHPEKKLKISAVTGTNGKTTTAFLLEQMLASVGRECVLVGTIETRVAGEVRESEHTTPESRDLYALFADGVAAGCTEVVMEMSSHALEQERVWGLPVDVGIFTNLTQDHLDFHGTMGAYARSKAKLFEGVGAPPPRVAVINADDSYEALMRKAFNGDGLLTYGIDQVNAVYCAFNVKHAAGGTHFEFDTPYDRVLIESPLNGRVNVSNLLAAMCAALARGLTIDEVATAVRTLKPVPGRFEVVSGSNEVGFAVVVDYAHTDDALRNLIALGHGLVGEHGGRVITMFGCGGDRDRTKRPKMGRVAGADSDLVVVTSDNPRSEEPMEIINEVLVGVRETNATFVVEDDRRAAIEVAIRAAKVGDIVLLAGKGHEKVQIFAGGAVPFDDVEEAARVLRILSSEDRK